MIFGQVQEVATKFLDNTACLFELLRQPSPSFLRDVIFISFELRDNYVRDDKPYATGRYQLLIRGHDRQISLPRRYYIAGRRYLSSCSYHVVIM